MMSPYETINKYYVGKGIDIGCGENPLRGINDIERQEIRPRGEANINYLCPCDTIPVEDERYDFVYASHVLEHLNNPIKALLEWRRILRVNGKIILIMPDCRLFIHDRKRFDIAEQRGQFIAELELLNEQYRNNIPNAPEDWENYRPWHHTYYYEHNYLWSLKQASELLEYLEFKIIESFESKPEFIELFDRLLLNKYLSQLFDQERQEKFFYDITKLQEEHNFQQLNFSFIVVGEKIPRQPQCLNLPVRKITHQTAMKKFVGLLEPFRPACLLSPRYLYRRLKTISSLADLKIRVLNVFVLVRKILTAEYKYPLR